MRDASVRGLDALTVSALLHCTDYCAEGAAAALPCPAGKRKDATLSVMDAESDCIVCPVGTFCPVGSAEAQACAPGTFNDQPQQETCTKCAAGSFQALEGKTACEVCTPGCKHSERLEACVTRVCVAWTR